MLRPTSWSSFLTLRFSKVKSFLFHPKCIFYYPLSFSTAPIASSHYSCLHTPKPRVKENNLKEIKQIRSVSSLQVCKSQVISPSMATCERNPILCITVALSQFSCFSDSLSAVRLITTTPQKHCTTHLHLHCLKRLCKTYLIGL